MEKEAWQHFVNHYIKAWSTTCAEERKQLIEKVYAPAAEFYANEPGDNAVKYCGLENIYANITQVNERLVVKNGLMTECTGYSANHNMLKVTWQMKTPDGHIVMKGMNFLQLEGSGQILKDFIFID